MAMATTAKRQQRAERGRPRRTRNFDPEAMRKVMEDPQVKAQMEEIQTQQEKLTAQLTTGHHTRFWAPPAGDLQEDAGCSVRPIADVWPAARLADGRGNNQAKAKTTTSRTPTTDDDDDDPQGQGDTPAAPAKAKAASNRTKKSLRELRGEPRDDN